MDTNQIQRQQLVDYVNSTLSDYAPARDLLPITTQNCFEALHDGVLLCYLVNCMSTTGEIIKQSELKKTKATLFHKMDQVNKALEATKKVGLNIIGIRSESIVEKKQNVILGLFNQITKQKPGKKMENYNEKFKKQQPKPSQTLPQQIERQIVEQKVEQTKISNKPIPEPIKQPQIIPQQSKVQQKIQIYQPVIPPIDHQQQFREQIQHIQINQQQFIPQQSANGYHFKEWQGLQVVILCGSLRRQSFHKGMINALVKISQKKYFHRIHFHVPDLNILPLLNEDLEIQGRIPKAIYDLQQIVRKSSGILIATPEYNGSFSGVLKNAFDWLSKSYDIPGGDSPLKNKKIGIISCSYLTENQIKDTKEMGQNFHCNYFSENFYLDLRSGAFNMQTGNLTNQAELNRLAYWYQQFSYFILSDKPNPERQARFIMPH